MKCGVFVTGTDTNIGKTIVSSLLVSAGLSYNYDMYYYKPVQTGEDEDSETVKNISKITNNNVIQPTYSFSLPAAPYLAALAENLEVDLDKIIQCWQKLKSNFYIIEGAGGLLVPLTQNLLIRDLIKALKLPVIIVAGTQLGTINHTLLTIESAKSAGLLVYGIVLNGEIENKLIDVMEKFSSIPVIAKINNIVNINEINQSNIAKKIFSKKIFEDLEKLSC